MLLDKVRILKRDLNEKGIVVSISHRLYKHKSLKKPTRYIVNLIKPSKVEINGLIMYLDKNDIVISEVLAFHGIWSPKETKLIIENLKKGEVFVDVGAHIGYFTLLAAKKVGVEGKVYAFEPNPDTFKLLKKNVKANGLKNVVLINKAVTNKIGCVGMKLNAENTGDSRISNITSKSEKVQTTTIDSEMGKDMVDFIKIDVQGAEPLVIEGAKKVIIQSNNLKVITEFWPNGIRKIGRNPNSYFNKLKTHFSDISTLDKHFISSYINIQSHLISRQEDEMSLYLSNN